MMLGAFFLVGCGDDETPNELIDHCEICPPETPDQLMENFEIIYSEMLVDEFRDMLDPDFQFILSPRTIEDWDWAPGSTFDFDAMISIHGHMFGGSAGTDHEGNGISPLDRIQIPVFERIGEWVVTPEDDPDFPNAGQALFEMKIFFHDNTGTHAFAVDQQVIFYVSFVDGIYYLQGINSVGNYQGKAIEDANYESVLFLFR